MLRITTVCCFVYVGLDLWKVEADRVVEEIAATDSDNPAECELFSTEGSSERDGSEVNTSPAVSLPLSKARWCDTHDQIYSRKQCRGRM